MGHGITESDSGFVTRDAAWHDLFPVVPDYITSWDEAREASGLTWEVQEVPVFGRYRRTVEDVVTETYRPVKGQKGIVRNDNGEWLAIVNDTYTPFPNADLGPLLEAIVGEEDVQYETAGSLKGGAKVWVMLRLRDPFEVPGDPKGATLPRCAVQNSHDGSGSLRSQFLQTRIVCDNTSQMADVESKRRGTQYTFRHTASIHDRVEEAKSVVTSLRDSRQKYTDWATDLLGVRITPEQEQAFIEQFFPVEHGVMSERVVANIHEARAQFTSILNDGDGTMPEDIRYTAYGLVQGAIEYLDHVRGYRSKATHFSRCYLEREPLKRKAETLARQAALV